MAAKHKNPFLRTVAQRLMGTCCAAFCMVSLAAPAVTNLPGDELVLAARDAARSGDVPRLNQISRQLQTVDGTHPLAAYPEYWALSVTQKRALDGNGLPLADELVRDFVKRNEGSVVGDLARRDWLLLLGKRRDFATFDVEYPKFLLNDDRQISCYALLSRHLQQQQVLDRARAALAQPHDLGDGCFALAQTLTSEAKLGSDDIWIWIRAAFDSNQIAAARRYASLLTEKEKLLPRALDAVYDKPAAWLARSASTASNRQNRELLSLALVRMARNDPVPTAALFQLQWERRLSPELGALVWAQIAAAGARKFLPQTNDWSRKSLPAKGLSEETLAWQARGALRAQNWALLRGMIDKMPAEMRRVQGGDGTWQYWLGRALKTEGRGEEANTLFRSIADQYHFYGQLALEELGQRIMLPVSGGPITEVELRAIMVLPGLARSLRFYQIGMRAPGNLEWNFTLRGLSDRQLLAAAEWARRNAIFDRAVNTAERTRSEHDFATRFLTPFRDQLQPRSDALGLDLAWVYGLIRQESRFVTNARSSAGASGLMQVMPATARYVARRIGLDLARASQADDAGTNLTLGTNYLRMVLADLDSLPVLATAAYNAGPGRSRAWRASLVQPVEGAIFAETIPFNETRDYVKKVMSNAVYYAALFEGKPQSLRTRLGMIGPKKGPDSGLP